MSSQNDKTRVTQTQLEKVQQATLREVDSDISRAHSDLFDPIKAPPAELPEHIFRNNFLPYFANQQQDDPQLNIRAHWVGIAGSATLPVNVVGTDGKVLFQVPPLMNTEFLREGSAQRGQSFNQILNLAREQGNRLPHLSDQVIAEVAGGKVAAMQPTVDPRAEEQWKTIFKHYGLEDKQAKPTQQTPTASNLDDELDFG